MTSYNENEYVNNYYEYTAQEIGLWRLDMLLS